LTIFGTYAPFYWAKNLPVIPLTTPTSGGAGAGKRPVHSEWSRFQNEPVSPDEMRLWVEQFPDHNLGLVLGPQSGVCVVDIDTYDTHVQDIIKQALPLSPWVRVGRKGAVFAYRYNGVASFQIKDHERKVIVEFLSAGRQVVLPPSIHPDTRQPYMSNSNLWDVIDHLPELSPHVEDILRQALLAKNVQLSTSGLVKLTEFVPEGARDTEMVRHAGLWAGTVCRGERTLLEALGEMEHWCKTYVQSVAGDEIDFRKGQQRIIQYLTMDVTGRARKPLPRGWDKGLTDQDKLDLGLIFDETHVEWSLEEMISYLQKKFEAHSNDAQERAEAVNFVLERLARSRSIDNLATDRLLNWISSQSRLNMTFSSLKTSLRERRQGDLQGNNHAELADALLDKLKERNHKAITPRHDEDGFWEWNGAHWTQIQDSTMHTIVAEEFGHMQAARRYADHTGIVKVLKDRLTQPLIKNTQGGINFANGYLTTELELKPHDPDFGAIYNMPYRWIADHDEEHCPKFMKFLHQIWGHDEDYEEKKQALREAMALTLFGKATRYSRAFVLYGSSHAGKSELLNIITGLMPENCSASVPPTKWDDKFAPAQMNKKLLNSAGELSNTKLIDGEMFKLIVEGAEIMAQHKGQQLFRFRPMCAQWFSTNYLPKSKDTSGGFLRRWLIFQFTKTVEEKDRVMDLNKIILEEEREAICAWACKAILTIEARRGFALPKSHHMLLQNSAEQMNTVRFFLRSSGMVRFSPHIEVEPVPSHELMTAYQTFTLGTLGGHPVKMQEFDIRMMELASEFGFKMKVVNTDRGEQYFEYSGIILGDRRGTSRKRA
jgi:P4 family phage/plasmid primase-like protien